MTPTERTLKKLKAEGFLPAVVEKWNPHARIRQDLYGFIDILAIKDGVVMGIQATSGANTASRVAKILAHPNWPMVKASGIKVEVWGWRKLKSGWEPNIKIL